MNKQQYTQLGPEERNRIYLLKRRGMCNKDIAEQIGRDKSTISRELHRNRHRRIHDYLPDTAQRKADKRKEQGRKQVYVAKQPALKKKIIKLLCGGWSPDLIAGRLKLQGANYLNQESIYQFIYSLAGRKLGLRQYLRRSHRLRHPQKGRKSQEDLRIPNRVDIDKRPKYVEKRAQFGHWEGDSILYNHHRLALSTSVERKTRRVILAKPFDRTAKEKTRCLIRRFNYLPEPARRTMTYDNGREAAAHEAVTAAIGMKFYFAKTYSSWQRGTNENRNGLVRFYLPRDTDLGSLTAGQIRRVENLINNRPVKCLGYQTPNEAFALEISKLKSG